MQDFQKIKEIFAAALEVPSENRETFLRQTCAADEELFAEVKSLLAASDETEQLIEENAFNFAAKLAPVGKNYDFRKFGNYTVLHEIGRGGMGAVFLAERNDGEFEQRVALKIIRQSFADAEIERHFRRERQILARLNHPNIAKLLDGGVSEAGELFLVMEYIEGKPLLDYAEKHKLNIEERLKLFLKICRAVSFAHQNLVIHRDIKPSNILVTKEGEPKLLDFGLAKMTEPNPLIDGTNDSAAAFDYTKTAFRAFTPAYASPEQILGKNISTTSDVYSLGVVLYELLTGKKPFHFEDKNLQEILRTIDTAEPVRPSSVSISKFQSLNSQSKKEETNLKSEIQNSKSLRGDLDNIVLKCLRKEPERRYKSVELFAQDIERYLNGLPVLARPRTLGYRAGKFIKRNRGISAVIALFLLSLIGGLAATVWQARVALAQRDRAEKRFEDVRKLSSSLLFEISPQIERLPGSTHARETIVQRALEYLDSLAAEASDNESLQSELASAYEQVGDVQGKPGKPNLGDLKGATESYLKAQKIRLALAGKDSANFDLKRLLAANYYGMGELLWWSSNVDGALENYRKALEIYENLIATEPENLSVNLEAVRAQTAIATALSYNSDRRHSIPIFRQMIARLEELKIKNPSDVELLRLLADTHIHLAYDLSWTDEMNEADEEVKKSLEIAEPLLAANSNDTRIRRGLLMTYFLAGGIFEDADPKRSRDFLEKSIALAKETVATDSADFQAKHDLAQGYSKLSVIAVSEKKFDEAIALLEQSEKILDELTAAEPRHAGYRLSLSNNFLRLGEAQNGKGDLKNALQSYEQAIGLQEKMRETDPTDNMPVRNLAVTNQKIAEIYEKLKEYEKAETFNQKGLEMFAFLKQKNAVDEYDKKTIEDLQSALARCREKKIRN